MASSRRFIGYPTDHMLAAFADPVAAVPAVAELHAGGIPDKAITLLRGPEGANRLDGTGAQNGLLARLRRLVSFTVMDQLVDMAMYERAVLDGGAVVMVRVRGDDRKAAALEVLRRHGAHFVNYYGRFATEEMLPWHGPDPEIASILKR